VAIHYHFGSKRAVYLAAVRQVARIATAQVAAAIAPARDLLRLRHATRRELIDCLSKLLDRFLNEALARPAGEIPESWRRSLLGSEDELPGAFTIIYPAVEPLYETIFRLIGRIVGRPAADPEVRHMAAMIFGQIYFLRTNRTFALRFLGYQRSDKASRLQIRQVARKLMIHFLSHRVRRSGPALPAPGPGRP
jgi:AcrR family transcriptional regulator